MVLGVVVYGFLKLVVYWTSGFWVRAFGGWLGSSSWRLKDKKGSATSPYNARLTSVGILPISESRSTETLQVKLKPPSTSLSFLHPAPKLESSKGTPQCHLPLLAEEVGRCKTIDAWIKGEGCWMRVCLSRLRFDTAAQGLEGSTQT